VPSCEICRTPYSARLRTGGRRLCLSTLRMKFSLMKATEKWLLLYYLVGALFSLFLISRAMMQTAWVAAEWSLDLRGEFTQSLREKPVEVLFTHLVLTSCFMREAVIFLMKLRFLLQ
jgi:hypothetical protein